MGITAPDGKKTAEEDKKDVVFSKNPLREREIFNIFIERTVKTRNMSALTFEKSELSNLEYSLHLQMMPTDRYAGYIRPPIVACKTPVTTD